jgi:hypothetical protein
MTFNKFKSILMDIRTINDKNSDYIDSIPTDISGAIFDNEFTNNQYKIIDILFTTTFKDYSDDAEWFVYDFRPNSDRTIIIEGRKYIINTFDDFFNYMQIEATFEPEEIKQ